MMTLKQLQERFSAEDACFEYLVSLRWPNGVHCARCGNDHVYKIKKPWKWQCKVCNKNGYRFSPLTGTIFENTNYPLTIWFQVIYLMCQSKKGMSALQIHRMIGSGSYRTAWYMCHRIRAAMQNEEFEKLMGEVEIDETYVGGKNKNRHADKKLPGRGTANKTPIIGAISRKGNVVAKVIEHADQETMEGFVKEAVSDKVSLVATDEHSGYAHLTKEDFPHESVNHSAGEYVRGNVHTQNIDGFWSLIKRGIVGTFHQVSSDYLPLYVNEFAFRHNNRKSDDIFKKVIEAC